MSTAHHPHGPSTLDVKAICPGFMKDPNQDTSAADRGTRLHKARETGDMSHCPEESDATLVELCINYIARLKKGMGEGAEQHDEVRMEIADGATFGTGDCILLSADHKCAHYVDTKFAWNKQTPLPENRQMKAYSSGIFDDYKSVEWVKVHVLYPQLGIVETHTYYRGENVAIKTEIKAIIARIEYFEKTGDVSVLRPTPVNCDRCGRKGWCPKLNEWAVPMAKRYEPLPFIENVHASQITNPGPQALAYYQVAELLEKMGKAAKQHLKELALKEGGFKNAAGEVVMEIGTKGQGFEVVDQAKLVEELEKLGLTPLEMIAFAKISVSDVRDHLANTKAEKGKKTQYKAQVEQALLDSGAIREKEPLLVLKKVKGQKAIDVETTVTE